MMEVDCIAKVKEILEHFNETQIEGILQTDKLDKTNIFDNFYKEYLWYFEINLKSILSDLKNLDFGMKEDKIVFSCLQSLRNDLIDISKKILISELYKMKEKDQLIGKNKYERYEYFNSLLTGNKQLEIIEANPVMAFLIINKLQTKLNLIKECFERFACDYKEIKYAFDLDIKNLENIWLDEGDTHNDGKSVIILEFNYKNKLVYKPHTMAPDESFGKLVNYINDSRYLKCPLKVAKAINKGRYGWQEFIKHKQCDNINQIKDHFYRIGVLLSIFNIIKSKDFHYENIIANGEYPVPIDLETILSNSKNELSVHEYGLAEAFVKEIDQSIYGSLMIPQNLEMFKFSVDLSGINGGSYEAQSIEFTRILNTGTDEIGYERVKDSIGEKQNRVKYNGKVVELQEYIPDIEKGLSDGYDFFIENKEKLISLIMDGKVFSGEYRQVLRATANYVKFIDAAIHPVYTNDFESRIKVFNYLYGKGQLTDERKTRVNSEINQLLKNDVPYFWAKFDTHDLHSADGTCLKDYYQRTICESVVGKIQLADKKEKEKQILYMKASIASLISIQNSNKYTEKYANDIFSNMVEHHNKSDRYIQIAKKIGEYLADMAIWNSDKDKCSFMALNYQTDGCIKYGPLNVKLYEGSGLLLFLSQLSRLTGDNKYKKIVESAILGFDELFNKIELQITSEGVFTGIGSLTFTYYSLWTITKDKLFYDRYKECLKRLIDFDFSKSEVIDVIDGVAGLSIMGSNIYEKENDDMLLELMEKCGEKLYSELAEEKDGYLTGFSHGYAGFSTALFMLAQHLNNEKYYNLGKDLVRKENEYYSEEKKNWKDLRPNHHEADPVFWCHGAAGVALSRAISKEYLKENDKCFLDRDIDLAVSKTLEYGFTSDMNQSLCHGSFGNIDCLLSVAIKTKDLELLERVYLTVDAECEKIIKNGIECANPLRVETINFMLGISGVGYQLLRLYDNNIPSILSLQV